MARSAFLPQTPHTAAHPAALVVYCSDGRFTRAVEELGAHLGHLALDTLTLPGGPALLSSSTSYAERESMSRGASFLIVGHQIRHVVLVAHSGCGYYRARYPGEAAAAIEARQLADLASAREALALAHPSLHIRAHYLRVNGKQVRFDEQ